MKSAIATLLDDSESNLGKRRRINNREMSTEQALDMCLSLCLDGYNYPQPSPTLPSTSHFEELFT